MSVRPPTRTLLDWGFRAQLIFVSRSISVVLHLRRFVFFQAAGKCSLTLGWFPYCNARSRSTPVAAACTGNPPVTIMTNLSTAPNPLKSPKYRCMCTGSIGRATRYPPIIARATSPTTPRLRRTMIGQMLASVYSSSSLSRASRSIFPSFLFFSVP